MKQRTFASLSYETKKKPTRREKFLGEMDRVVPWADLQALIAPHYPTSGLRCTKSSRCVGLRVWS
ncbi:hypothetical protein C7456_106233 [Fulvimonas soli]|jgi:IS5 family transposase|uniref:IS5 family transposase n=1 Tax=Fulvimonas soli TaxID=155197 RepID=A0A316I5L7_9GAMM|nr:hypothetical protein C7456_106233 [Fulvimonas soli]